MSTDNEATQATKTCVYVAIAMDLGCIIPDEIVGAYSDPSKITDHCVATLLGFAEDEAENYWEDKKERELAIASFKKAMADAIVELEENEEVEVEAYGETVLRIVRRRLI